MPLGSYMNVWQRTPVQALHHHAKARSMHPNCKLHHHHATPFGPTFRPRAIRPRLLRAVEDLRAACPVEAAPTPLLDDSTTRATYETAGRHAVKGQIAPALGRAAPKATPRTRLAGVSKARTACTYSTRITVVVTGSEGRARGRGPGPMQTERTWLFEEFPCRTVGVRRTDILVGTRETFSPTGTSARTPGAEHQRHNSSLFRLHHISAPDFQPVARREEYAT